MSTHYEVKKDEFRISTDPALLDVNLIHHYLSAESYWARNIPRVTVEQSIQHSLCFGMYNGDAQTGFARLITDRATFAYLADVFILPDYRGRGLSKWLIETIQSHPELQQLRRWMLGTRDAHGLYEQFGWTPLDEAACQRFMQRHFPDVYSSGIQ
ncbi:MAG: GNAT family N-acetyltransferase [Bacteroidetes bacterium]|nr:GNAT family N-acetyltransferase [Bacteroidota bacterium]